MTVRWQAICGWCGLVSVFLAFLGMGPIAQISPPPSPFLSALETATKFQQNADAIMLGAFCLISAGGLSILFVACVSAQIRLMGLPSGRVLSYIQLTTGVAACTLLIPPAMIWTAAAYRAERAPEIVQALDDIAAFSLYLPFSVAILNALVIAVAILSDRGSTPFYPRWLGYLTGLMGLSLVPMGFIGLYKIGLLAADGLIGYTVPTILVFIWMVLMSVYMIRSGKALLAHNTTAMHIPS